jgi:hypothetical protein
MQADALKRTIDHRLCIILKARQLGMTWLTLGINLWLLLYHPVTTALLFSRREDEATYLLDRLRGMYDRLPDWQKVKKILKSNSEMWSLSNGSVAYGFPTTAGDSYTATIATVDEADLVPNLDKLMNAVKPTIDGGGRMILLSRSNKDDPNSAFKNMFRAAVRGESSWHPVFLPWWARPSRDQEWYEEQKADVLGRTGSLDDLYQQYPETPEQALMAKQTAKRIPIEWLDRIFEERRGIEIPKGAPSYGEITYYVDAHWSRRYFVGADPAEGNPTSDDSSAHVVDLQSGEEVAHVVGKIQPTTFAQMVFEVAQYFNNAPILVERNNHGHAVIAHLTENTSADIALGWDGDPGWMSSTRGKALMWTIMADAARDKAMRLYTRETYTQLSSIEGATLKAPKGSHDDEAVSFSLATVGVVGTGEVSFAYRYIEAQ